MNYDKLRAFFTVRTIWILLALWVANNLWMWFGPSGSMTLRQLAGRSEIPDVMILGYTVESLNGLLADFGAKGREIYLSFQYKDFTYPLIYSTLLAGLFIRVKPPRRLLFMVFLPWVAALTDFAENLMLRKIVTDFPVTDAALVQTASLFTVTKWSLIFISVSAIILIKVVNLVRRR
jgi:hypothetical protein